MDHLPDFVGQKPTLGGSNLAWLGSLLKTFPLRSGEVVIRKSFSTPGGVVFSIETWLMELEVEIAESVRF